LVAERDEARAELEAVKRERDMLLPDVTTVTDAIDVYTDWADSHARIGNIEKENESLRAELARLHPLADGYAGAIADLAAMRRDIEAATAREARLIRSMKDIRNTARDWAVYKGGDTPLAIVSGMARDAIIGYEE
jgi:chromosome segregation ATPase